MSTEIYGRLTPLMQDVFLDDDIAATPELSADDVEAWSSLNNIRLLTAIEEEFGVEFSLDEVGSFANVGDLVVLIQAKLSA